jgi:hypothetical protein
MIETVAETVAETIPAKPTEYKSTGFTSQDIRHYHDDKNALYMLPNDQFGMFKRYVSFGTLVLNHDL